MPNDTLVKIKDLSQAEILGKIRSNEIEVPKKGDERDEFMKFVAAAPGSDIRTGMISDNPPAGEKPPEGAPPAEGQHSEGSTPPGESNPPSQPGKTEIPDATPPKGSEPPTEKPPEGSSSDNFLGYGSKEAMEEAHRKLLSDVGDLRKQIDRLNESGGKLGQQKKDLEQQLQNLHKQIKTGKPPESPTDSGVSDVDVGEPPKAPKPDDFEGGLFDDDYQTAANKYMIEMGEYAAKVAKVNAGLRKKISDVEQKAATAFEHVDNLSKGEKQKAWDSFWGKIREHMTTAKINTSVDIAAINDAIIRKDNDYLSRLPKSDMEAFNRIKPLANRFADFTQGYPELRYDSVADLIKEQQQIWGVPVEGSTPPSKHPSPAESQSLQDKVRRDQEESVAVPPSGVHGQPPKDITSQSNEEAAGRLRELTKMRAQNVTRFDNNKDLSDEFNALRNRFGIGAKKR